MALVAVVAAWGCAQTTAAPPAPEPRAGDLPSAAARAPATPAASANTTPSPSNLVTPAPAPEVPDEVRWRQRWQVCPPGQALDEAQSRSLDYFRESPFSVIRVGPADTLNLRSSSSADATSLGQLDFRQTEMRWTGSACNVRGALWFEVVWQGLRGWVNGYYAQPTSKPRDETELVKSALGSLHPKSFAQFLEQLRRAVARQEAPPEIADALGCEVTIVGSEVKGTRARVVVFALCGGNDSTEGSQLFVNAARDRAGWEVVSVEWRDVCKRGADELCI